MLWVIWNDDETDSGSPADRSNLRESDCVVRINGRNVSRSTAESVAKIIKYVCWANEMIERIPGVTDGESIVKFNRNSSFPSMKQNYTWNNNTAYLCRLEVHWVIYLISGFSEIVSTPPLSPWYITFTPMHFLAYDYIHDRLFDDLILDLISEFLIIMFQQASA